MTNDTNKQKEFLQHLTKTQYFDKTWQLLFEASPELADVFFKDINLIASMIEKENDKVRMSINNYSRENLKTFEYSIENPHIPSHEQNFSFIMKNINPEKLWYYLKNDALEKLNDFQNKEAPLLYKIIINQENYFNKILSEILFNKNNNMVDDIVNFFNKIKIPLRKTSNLFKINHNIKGIHFAVEGGNTALTELLLSNGIDIETLDEQSNTPLFFANNIKILDVLDKYNPKLEAANKNNETAYNIVINSKPHSSKTIKEHPIWNNSNILKKDILLKSFKQDKVSDFKNTIKEHDIDTNLEIEGYPLIIHTSRWGENIINQKITYLTKTNIDFSKRLTLSNTSLLSYTMAMLQKPYGENKTEEKNYKKSVESLAIKAKEIGLFDNKEAMYNFVFETYKNIIFTQTPETKIPLIVDKNKGIIEDKITGNEKKDYLNLIINNEFIDTDISSNIDFLRSKEYEILKKQNKEKIKQFEKLYQYKKKSASKGNCISEFLEKMQMVRNVGYKHNNPAPYNINRIAWCLSKQLNKNNLFDYNYKTINKDIFKNEIIAAACNNDVEEMAWATLNAFPKLFYDYEKLNIDTISFSEQEVEALKISKISNFIKISQKMTLSEFIESNFNILTENSSDDFKKAVSIDYKILNSNEQITKNLINENNKLFELLKINHERYELLSQNITKEEKTRKKKIL